MIVLDTSALLFWTLDPAKLSSRANQAIDRADRLVVSSISIWEIGLKVKRRRLEIPIRIADYAARLQHLEKLEILAVDMQTWLDNLSLDWKHRDPADRTIVATANRLGCPLITSDGVISEFYDESIW
jgi:PIN domain nuclease of toxin-antitoxin system